MKNYKEFKKENIGSSDIASLTIRSGMDVATLNFGEDGNYSAYNVYGIAEIGDHYKKVFEGKNWLKIYDDDELTWGVNASIINVYRACEMGCIIQSIDIEEYKATMLGGDSWDFDAWKVDEEHVILENYDRKFILGRIYDNGVSIGSKFVKEYKTIGDALEALSRGADIEDIK